MKWLLALPAALVAYLAVVGGWAWASFDDAMAGVHIEAAAQLSPRQIAILTQVEDPAFFSHRGVSLAAGQGVATISSALARDVYLSGADFTGVKGMLQTLYRGIFTCCKKVDLGRDVMAVVLNARMPKERQLALYAARVYMGTQNNMQVRGLNQAALMYLGKPLSATGDEEFIALVAMIKAPNQFHPARQRRAWAERVASVRALVSGLCHPAGWFDTALADCATNSPR